MVSTRSHSSTNASLYAAARTLLSLRNSSVTTAATPATATTTTAQSYKADSKFMTLWENWYHAFLSEATDENPSYPIADRRSQATSRWVTFASKQMRCTESVVRAWLRQADQKALLNACA
jgi:hypothetical protein